MENNINKNVDDGLEIHEFSEEYRQHKEKMIAGLKELEKNDSIENSHSSAVRGKILNRSVKIAAAVLICVVLVPVTIHAAVNLYKMTVTRDGVDLKVDIRYKRRNCYRVRCADCRDYREGDL